MPWDLTERRTGSWQIFKKTTASQGAKVKKEVTYEKERTEANLLKGQRMRVQEAPGETDPESQAKDQDGIPLAWKQTEVSE